MISNNGKTVLEVEVEKLIDMEQARYWKSEVYHERIYKRLDAGDVDGAVEALELFRRSNQKLNGIQTRIIKLTIDAVAVRQVTEEASCDAL